jgi:hypothetical protein
MFNFLLKSADRHTLLEIAFIQYISEILFTYVKLNEFSIAYCTSFMALFGL